MSDSNKNLNDPDEPGIIRTQKAHQVTIEQGSKNAAGKRAEIAEAQVKKVSSPNRQTEETSFIAGREVAVDEAPLLPSRRADGLLDDAATPQTRMVHGEEGQAGDHREQATEALSGSEHREKALEESGTAEHRERIEELPGGAENRVKLDTNPVHDPEDARAAGAGVGQSNFQAAPESMSTSGRVLAPEVAGLQPRDWTLSSADSSEEVSKEDLADADVEEEIEVEVVMAELDALAQDLDEPPAEFYEQMDFPARVVHLHIENEKVQAQIKELEKPWERV
jgi:hypothetical protein